jgi:hypothetical protein
MVGPDADEGSRRLAKRDGSKVAKLALLAANAVRNADMHRALELLAEISAECGAPAAGLTVIRGGR